VPIISLETLGSNCFYSSISLNSDWEDMKGVPQDIEVVQDETHGVKVAHLKKLSSRATSLGASWASPGVIKKALGRKGGLKCVCISDTMSMNAAVLFAGMSFILCVMA
jgi:L-serine/L-threonine ammonia-lyase